MNLHLIRNAMLVVAVVLPRVATGDPEVKSLYPAGGETGRNVDVTVNGNLPKWPVRVWVDRPGLVATARDADGEEQRILSVNIASDAVPGVYRMRLYDDSGAAAPQLFVVGTLPEELEQEPNDKISEAQRPLVDVSGAHSVTINGRLEKRGDVDVYAVKATRGQTLVADMDAHTPLGVPIDAVLQFVSPEGFVLAQNDDQHLLDPRLAVDIPRDGLWLIRVFGFPATPTSSIQFAGDASYVYRLTLSTGPYVEFSLPLAAHAETPTQVELFGWNLTPPLRQLTLMPESKCDERWIASEGLARSIRVPVVTDHLIAESDSSTTESAVTVKLPVTITGRIQQPGERDVFAFQLGRDDTLVAQIESRVLGYPLDAVLELLDADGKQLAKNDDVGDSRDAALKHRVKVDTPLRLVVSDLHGVGGENFVYRLRLSAAEPDYKMSIADHQIKLAPGEKSELTVDIQRLQGHDKPISISAQGLPPGVSAATAESIADNDSAKQVKLVFDVDPDAEAASVPVQISGSDGQPTKLAEIALPLHGAPLVDLWMTVEANEDKSS